MSLTKYPNGVSSFGLPVIGGRFISTGTAFFVDSNTGSNSYDGKDKTQPFSTIAYAIGKCTADKGDIIYAMPGHIETVDTGGAVNFNKAGVTLIGIGNGYLRPQFLITGTCGSVAISSCDVAIENCVIMGSTVALVHPIEVNASDFTLLNCEYLADGTSQLLATLVHMAATSDDRMTIDGLRCITQSTTGDPTQSVSHIFLGGGLNHVIKNSFIAGMMDTSGACVNMSSASTLPNYLFLENDVFVTTCSTAGICLIDVTTAVTTGIFSNVYMGHGDDAEQFVRESSGISGEYAVFECYGADQSGERGFILNSTAASAT